MLFIKAIFINHHAFITNDSSTSSDVESHLIQDGSSLHTALLLILQYSAHTTAHTSLFFRIFTAHATKNPQTRASKTKGTKQDLGGTGRLCWRL